MDWGIQNTFRCFNQAEGTFWILLGLAMFVVMARRRRDVELRTAAGLLFIAFGLSDFVEIHTGGWYKPWWLLAWKATNLAGLFGVFLGFRHRTAVLESSCAGSIPDPLVPPSQEKGGRLFQALLLVSAIGFSWLGMMVVHELGHVLHLWLSGGRVNYVILHPLMLSYTHPAENPHPLFVAWGGAFWGCLLPWLLLIGIRYTVPAYAYLAAFFAGFCLIANGAYLAGDAFLQCGDGRELIGHGTPPWLLVPLGLPLVAFGLWLWNGLGPHFGLSASPGQVDRRVALGTAIALALLITLEVLLLAGT